MQAIPLTEDPEVWEDRSFLDSEFVLIRDDDHFEVQMQYPLMKMKNAEEECLVRREVWERLKAAAKKLPAGYRIRIWDAWRPFALQQELYEVYSGAIIREYGLMDKTAEERKRVIHKFVSEPVYNRDLPPVHTTGGAVDVTLIDERGRELKMGTGFDDFTGKAHTASFEGTEEAVIRDNRRLLYGVMTAAGFTNLPSEWWHYDYGDRFWGYYSKKTAIYRGAFTKEETGGRAEFRHGDQG
ncbi:MAG: M15 family metallopeptidase [Lachnospiraceae bacterium]|nr:M15 family metallopeptidase [Lachnospiraceae bacterium]